MKKKLGEKYHDYEQKIFTYIDNSIYYLREGLIHDTKGSFIEIPEEFKFLIEHSKNDSDLLFLRLNESSKGPFDRLRNELVLKSVK